MKTANQSIGSAQAVQAALAAITGLVCAWFSYDFGAELGGVLMGVIAAGNAGLMATLLSAALLDRLTPRGRE